MKDFLHELIIIGTSVGILGIREIIALILKYLKTPVEVRQIKKHNKHQEKANRMKERLNKLKEKETKENGQENN